MPNALVTGAAGSLGKLVMQTLPAYGFDCIGVDVRDQHTSAGAFISCDLRDAEAFTAIVQDTRPAVIVHLAAVLFQSETNPRFGCEVNIGGMLNVLEATTAANVRRVVFTSAKTLYGQMQGEYAHPSYRAVPESRPANPDSIYGLTKLACERLGFFYAKQRELEFIAVRLATLYGPDRMERHAAVAGISAMVEAAVKGDEVAFPHGGDQGDDILYTTDAAEAICKAVLVPTENLPSTAEDRVFNVGSGVVSRFGYVADVLQSIIPNADVRVGSGLDYMGLGKQYYMLLEVSRAANYLDFRPRFTLEEGLEDYVRRAQSGGNAS